MTRILVTGASGCVGRHVLPRLVSAGWETHAVGRTPAKDDVGAGTVVWHAADLLDPAARRALVEDVRPTHLMHLAWYVAPGRWADSPENLRWLGASLDLFAQFQAAGGERLVTSGSCLEYDWRYGYCSETLTPCTPHTLYGTCKHALQLASGAWARTVGLSAAWARIFFLYGPGEHADRLVPAVVRALLSGEPARCSHGRQVRDYLFADDVASALVQLVDSGLEGPINVGSGRAVTLGTIVGRIGTLIGRPELIQRGAIPAAPTDTPLVVADTTRLSQELGWRPSVDLDAGLSATIRWWADVLAQETGSKVDAWTT